MRIRFPLLTSLGLLLAAPVLPSINTGAQAQSIEIGPGGVRVNPDRDFRRSRWRVSEREAVRIARRYGLIEVNRVVGSGREWRVSGISRRGGFIRVVIDARSGDVLRVIRGRG
jgi:hypothetical protein